MLGSVSEAENVLQEAFLRLHRAREGGERIESPRAYLSTVVSRLSLDQLRSARARRETYVGEWLPEPLVASADDNPARKAEMADSLSLAFLVLLESLSPEQRAAFLLREVFDEPYDRITVAPEVAGSSPVAPVSRSACRTASSVASIDRIFGAEHRRLLPEEFLSVAAAVGIPAKEAVLCARVSMLV
jgi:RNA polymerase sigma-70 factor (ECF subfamily)